MTKNRGWLIPLYLAALGGCAGQGMSLSQRTALAIGLPGGSDVAISDDTGQGIVGHRYYTATTKTGQAYNCTIFSNLGFEDRPQCVKQGEPLPTAPPFLRR